MDKAKPKATIKKELKGVPLSESYIKYEKYNPKKYAKKPMLAAYKPKKLSDTEALIDNEDDEQEITEEEIMSER